MSEFDQKYGKNFRVSHYDADIVESFALRNDAKYIVENPVLNCEMVVRSSTTGF